MMSNSKIVDRKKDMKQVKESEELRSASQKNPGAVVEIDLSFNQLDNAVGLEMFPNTKVLILDHNNFQSMNTFPRLEKVETLSLSYNALRNLDQFPNLKNLNVMKNPMNPMFESESKYDVFRATCKIWLPSLQTLDGTDFSANQATINAKRKEIETQRAKILEQNKVKERPLESIPEEGKSWGQASKKNQGGGEDLLQDLKKQKGTFQFNQRAYRKYHSSRSLVERILKSHSEGNRFIRNDDL